MFLTEYNDYSTTEGFALFAFLAVYAFVLFIFAVAGYVISSIFMSMLFTKAGVDKKWRAWVPIYNTMIFLKLGDINPWYFFISFIPFVGNIAFLVLYVLAMYRINLKLGLNAVGYTIFGFFLSLIWLIVVAVNKAQFNPAAVPPPSWYNNILKDNVRFNGVPNQGYVPFNS